MVQDSASSSGVVSGPTGRVPVSLSAEDVRRRSISGSFIAQQSGGVCKLPGKDVWMVQSQSDTGVKYEVVDGDVWSCECEDHKYRGVECKHIYAVKTKFNL